MDRCCELIWFDPLVLVSYFALVRSLVTLLLYEQLEWMSEDIGRAFDLQRSNPFELRNVHIMHSLEELDELGDDPKVMQTASAQM